MSTAGNRTGVLAMVRAVSYGQEIADADLAVVDVAVDSGVETVPAAERDNVVGTTALVPLFPGMLLVPAATGSRPGPSPGTVTVTLAVPLGRVPVGGLATGQRVMVVNTPGADADLPTTPPPTLMATVLRAEVVDPELARDSIGVDVSVASADGPTLAAWSATGRIAIIVTRQ